MLTIREPQFSVQFGNFPPFDPSQLSDVPESETWREGIVTERTEQTGIVTLSDGAMIGFTNGNLLRNWTHYENTLIGAKVWVTERGGISAHPPSTRSARARYDAMLREQVRTIAASVDADAIKSAEEIYRR